MFHFAFLVYAYWHLQYFSSTYFNLLYSSLHIDICSIAVRYISLCFDSLWILTSAVFKLYILHRFSCICILTSAIFQYCTFYFAFLLLFLPLIGIYSISVLYILLCLPCLCIFTSAVFNFCIIYFAFLVFTYWHLQYFSSAYFTLLFTSLHIDTCSTSLLYSLLSFPHPCILKCAVF